jgi:hypothetical protein
VHPHLSNFRLLKSRNRCLPLHLIQRSSSYLTIYGVDRFGISCFAISRLAKTRFFPFGFPGTETLSRQPRVSPDGRSRRIRGFAYRDFHVPVQLQRVFKPCTRFPDLTVTRVLLSPNRSYGSNTSGVESSLLVAIYHIGCGFITSLHLLSLVTRSSNSLTLKSIQRSEIGPLDTISPQTLGPKTTQLAHLGSASKPWL